MAQRRPVSFIVFAIFNFILAATFIVCGVCANISDTAEWHVSINNVRFDPVTLKAHLNNRLPGYTAIKITGIVTGYAVCVGLILSGVALLYGKFWGKLLALFVYALAFFHHAALMLYQLIWVNPAINSFFDQIPIAMLAAIGMIPRVPGYIQIAWMALGMTYYAIAAPVVAFSSTSTDAEETDEEEEDDEEPPPRKRSRRSRDNDDDDDDDYRSSIKRSRR